jgi:LPS export ABC transporter protein LptC
MGIKIEKLLIVAIAIVAILPYFFKVNNFESQNRVIKATKSSEIIDFVEYDINSTSQVYKLYGKKAEEIGDLWYLTNPKIVNSEIESLISKRAISKGDNIEFINDVKLVKVDGKKYSSQRAIYNIKTKIITTPNKFLISKEYDMVKGNGMKYNTSKQETKAKNVKATFKIKDR